MTSTSSVKVQQIDAYRWRIPREGQMRVDGLVYASEPLMRAIRGDHISIIFQEPMTSLSPLHTIGDQIGEAMQVLGDYFGCRVIRRPHATSQRLLCLRYQRPFPFDPVEQHRRKDAIPFVIEHLRSVGV